MEKVNDLLDDPRFSGIINSSRWPTTKCINTATKNEFLQCIIFSEVIDKRRPAIQAFCRGLDLLSVHKLLQENSDLMKQAFLDVYSKAITPDNFISLISTPRPSGEHWGNVYDWCLEYLQDEEKRVREASLEQILQFCTGLKRVPPMGLRDRITIKYMLHPLSQWQKHVLALSSCQLCTLITPFFFKIRPGYPG